MTWRDLAACAGMNQHIFFPEAPRGGRGGGVSIDQWTQARRICHQCPVSDECLRYAQTNQIEHGMWGGLTPQQRSHRCATCGRYIPARRTFCSTACRYPNQGAA